MDDCLENLKDKNAKITSFLSLIFDSLDFNGCQTKRINDLFTVSIGKTPPRKEQEWFNPLTNGVPWLSIKDFGKNEAFISSTEETLTADAVRKFKIPVYSANTLLMSFKLTLGKVGFTAKPMCTNEAIAAFLPSQETEKYIPFLFCYLRTLNLSKCGNTSSIANAINSGIIRNLSLPIMGDEALDAFNHKAIPLLKILAINSKKIASLQAIKTRLLSKYFGSIS